MSLSEESICHKVPERSSQEDSLYINKLFIANVLILVSHGLHLLIGICVTKKSNLYIIATCLKISCPWNPWGECYAQALLHMYYIRKNRNVFNSIYDEVSDVCIHLILFYMRNQVWKNHFELSFSTCFQC